MTGDGSWITGALMAGTLSIVHDGSDMKKVTPRVCSMAILMQCLSSGNELTCTWSELSTSADNYRGELLGAVCCSLILRAASMVPAVYPSLLHFHSIVTATIWEWLNMVTWPTQL